MGKYMIQKQHDKGKYHAIERITLVLDKGSFFEIGSGIVNYGYNSDTHMEHADYDGVITGYGKINGQTVYIFAQDFTIRGGSLGAKHGKKIAHIIECAIKARCPVIGIYDSGGARIDEGINALAGCGEMMYYNTLASGYIPQISIIAGPCAGAAAYSPAISDFIFMIDKIGCMFITGMNVVKNVTGEECTLQELGGARVHNEISGVSHFTFSKEKDCFHAVKRLVTMLPSSYAEDINYKNISYIEKDNDQIVNILPSESKKVYDMKAVINQFVDDNSFIEVHEEFARSIIVGFAKLSKITIGIIANQPSINSGSIDSDSSDKAARFVQFCDSFNIPVITFVDTPGYMPGTNQEHNGIIRHGAKLLFAYAQSTIIKLTVIIRKAYGGAYIAMGSKHLGADFVYAWPQAEVAVMGSEGAISILYKREISTIEDDKREKFIKENVKNYSQKYMNADIAVQQGYIDEIIEPYTMRKRLFSDIIALGNKKDQSKPVKKHGNIPL